jgi:hypothetical protein
MDPLNTPTIDAEPKPEEETSGKVSGQTETASVPPRTVYRRLTVWLWRAAWALLLVMLLFPVRFDSLRMLMVGVVLFLWGGALALYGCRKIVLAVCLSVGLLAAIVLISPGGKGDHAALRAAYVRSLERYDGVTYVWGGETHVGVDCSGLMRCGLRDACLSSGLRTFNPTLLRENFSLWWHDSSAKAMGEGYRGLTLPVLETRSLNELDYTRIEPGDIAVTSSGLHVMAYLGNREWIEADPKEGRVIRVQVPAKDNVWFDMSMRIMRWRILEP